MNLMSHTVVIVLKDFQISKRCNFPTCFLLFFSISSRHCSTTGTSWLLRPLLINKRTNNIRNVMHHGYVKQQTGACGFLLPSVIISTGA